MYLFILSGLSDPLRLGHRYFPQFYVIKSELTTEEKSDNWLMMTIARKTGDNANVVAASLCRGASGSLLGARRHSAVATALMRSVLLGITQLLRGFKRSEFQTCGKVTIQKNPTARV
jgi:hypothetical protein